MQLYIGLFLIACPFIAMAIKIVRDLGWKELAIVFAGTGLVIGTISAGVFLVHSGLNLPVSP